METSLHQSLKRRYGAKDDEIEVAVGCYRIDAISDGRLIEIQLASLAAIRDKVRALLRDHRVTVVKPIVAKKTLVKRAAENGPVISRRLSPKRGAILDLFHELVHFTGIFPHKRFTLEVPLIEIEEWRYPGHGRRRRWRRDDHEMEDQKLLAVQHAYQFRTASDLAHLIDCPLPPQFDTQDLAEALQVSRWMAQRIAYCLRETKAAQTVGKQGNAHLYAFPCKRIAVRERIA